MAEPPRRVSAQPPGDSSTETTRPVALYRVQTVARPMLPPEPGTATHAPFASSTRPKQCRADDPPTHCYPSGLLARLHGESDPRSREPATVLHRRALLVSERDRADASSHLRAHVLSLTLPRRAVAIATACGACAITLALLVRQFEAAAPNPNTHAPTTADASDASRSSTPASAKPEHGIADAGVAAGAKPDQGSALAETWRRTAAVRSAEVPARPGPTSRARQPSPRTAAEFLARGRHPEALDAYRQLARTHPERNVYGHLATVIERRWTERCAQAEAAGEPCVPARP